MERITDPYGKEYMKMAILKHQETFKEQVYELHRLYQIQTILMKNVQANRPDDHSNQRERNFQGRLNRNCYQGHSAIRKKERRIDLEIPAEEYIQVKSDEGIPENNEDYQMEEVELTLGLGIYSSHIRKAQTTPLTSDSGLASYSSSSTESNRSMKAGFGSQSHPNAGRNGTRAWEDLQESKKDIHTARKIAASSLASPSIKSLKSMNLKIFLELG